MKTNRQITSMLQNEYQSKHMRNKIQYTRRKKEVYKKHPQLEKIDDEISENYLKIMKASIEQDTDTSLFYKKIDSLKKERDLYIKNNHVNIHDMQMQYDCYICKDTGIIENNARPQKCQCYINRYNTLIYENTNMLDLMQKSNFDNFDINIFDDTKKIGTFTAKEFMQKMKDKAISFVDNFDDPEEKSMIFYGNTGLGKSYMCLCIAGKLIKKKKNVVYESSVSLFEKLANYTFSQQENKKDYEVFNSLVYSSDLLIIDDLGTEITNNFVRTELFNIVNIRILNNKKTIISTNLNHTKLQENYEQRVFSRFVNSYHFYKFIGDDLRIYSEKI